VVRYSELEDQNLQTLNAIIQVINDPIIPGFNLFQLTPNILESFEVFDLKNFDDIFIKKTG